MLDYHLHLLAHGQDGPFTADAARDYAARAGAAGIEEVAITEHLFRFREAETALGPWWDDEPDRALRDQTLRYWREHATRDLDQYVSAVLEAAADPAGPGSARIRLGLEVDWYPERMDAVAELLAGYPFDVLLGSVHWLGGWGFDQYDDPIVAAAWAASDIDDVWERYVRGVEEMAATAACDVLAHVDLVKLTGARPHRDVGEWYERMVKAAARHGRAVEASSAGWRKPVGEAYPDPSLLEMFCAAGVGATTASDAHDASTVAHRAPDLESVVRRAGYTGLTGFVGRVPEARRL